MPSIAVQFANAVAATGTGSVDVESNAVTGDASGNVYVTGSLVGTADFDPGSGVTNLNSAGGRDVFLAKYGSTGALVWARGLRGADSTAVAQGAAVVVDASGNVIISGTFTGTVNFDPGAGNASLSAPGRNDVFVAKYSAAGNLLWARSSVGTAGTIDEGYALAVDGSGNLAVAGSFQGAATFGGTTLNAGGNFEAFVAKLDSAGNFLWAAATAGSGSSVAQASGLTFDGSGNVISAGLFAGSVDFNPGAGTLTLPYAGSRDAYVQKLDGSGNLVWAQPFGSPDLDQANAVVADASGNVYVTGSFSGTVDFDPGAGTTNLTAGGFFDAFLLKLNASGGLSWARDLALTGFNSAQGTGVGLDASNHVFTAGYFQGTMTLATGATLTSAGGYDVFVGEYDTAGNYVASQGLGGTGFDAEFGLGVNASGQVAVAGRYTGPAAFGSITLPAQANKAIFVAQLGNSFTPPPPFAPSAPTLQAASDTGLSNSDRITNSRSLSFDTGTITAGNTVQLFRDGTLVATRVGQGTITDPGPVSDGVHVYTARQVDAFSQASPASSGTSVTVKTSTPTTPAVPVLLAADDSGAKGDGVTNVRQPRFTGTVDASTLVQLVDGSGNVVGSVMAGSDGSYTVSPTSALADGSYSLKIREQDVAGNFSAAGAALSLTIDATAPATPGAPGLLAADDSGTVGDGITSVRQPRLTGTAEANATVQLVNASGTVIGTATASGTGSYTVSPTTALAEGTSSLRVQAVDAAGNVGSPGASFSLTVDATAPTAPPAPSLLAADDSGAVGDGITSARQPRLTGTAEARSTVKLLNAANAVLGTATADASGNYTVTPTSAFADGVYSLRVQATDAAGNTGPAGASFSLTVDATAPSAPPAPSLFPGDDTGTPGDGVTSVRQPRLTGTAEAGSTVRLINAANTVLGTATADGSGNYTVSPTSAFTDGTYSLRVQAVDAAGNVSTASAAFSLTVSTTGPAAPPAPSLLAADDSGVAGDGITNVKRPRLVGTTVANVTVQLLNAAGAVLGTATAAANGSYTATPTSAFTDGTYALRVQVVDGVGNVSTASGAFSLTVDSTAPAAPPAPSLLAADDSGAAGDGLTNVKQPRLTGTAEANATVQLVNAAGTVLGTATANASGGYTVSPASALADGTYSLRVQAVDVAGNAGPAGASFSLTIDSAAPAAPPAPTLLAADDSGVAGDGITNVKQPRLTGTAEANATVQLVNAAGTVLGTATAAANGAYTVSPASPLADGVYTLRVQAVDAAGNTGAAGAALSLTVDATPPSAPGAPTLLAADDSGLAGDGVTNVKQPRLTGTTVASATVQLVNASGTVLGTATANASGAFTVAPTAAFTDGTYALRVQVVDVAGNVSAPGAALSLTVDTAAPSAPAAPTLLPADDSGTPGDGVTSVSHPRLKGTAEANATVQLVNAAGTVLGTATADATGAYTVSPSSALADAVYSLRARAVDAAGNTGAAGAALSLTVDTTGPAAPPAPALLAADDSGAAGDGLTNVKQPRLTGTTEPGAIVQLVDGSNTVVGSGVAGADGTYTFATVTPLADGTYALRARGFDAAGNLGAAGAAFTLVIDTTAPAAPAAPVLLAADDSGVKGDNVTSVQQPHLTGTVGAGFGVQIVNASGTVLGTGTAAADGAYSVRIASPLPDGTYALQARVTDLAGNTGLAGSALSLTIQTPVNAPATPSAPVLLAADDTGTAGDGVTGVKQPRFTGTATPGLTVQLVNGVGAVIGSAAAAGDGTYLVAVSAPFADGSYSVLARVQDGSGNLSGTSGAFALTVDATAPAAPGAPTLVAADDSGVAGDGVTNVRQPRFTGQAEPGATVQLLNAAGSVVGTATAGPDGTYTVSPINPLGDAAYSFRTQAVDAAGNVSSASAAVPLAVDATAPSAPSSLTLLAADDTGTAGDGITSVTLPRLTGTAEPASTVRLIDGSGNVVGTASATLAGGFTVAPASALADGTYTVRAQAVDAAGNVGPAGPSFTLRILSKSPPSPAAPALLAADDTGTVGDGRTAVRQPRLTGTVGAGLAVDLLNAAGTVIATATADASGAYTLKPTAAFGTGAAPVRVRTRDVAGNASPAGSTFSLTVLASAAADFDGDGKTDLGVFRPSTSQWISLNSSGSGARINAFGAPNLLDIPVPGDYDGDGKADMAVFRPSTAQWLMITGSGPRVFAFGGTNLTDIPVPGDYDGVGYTEPAIYRPTTGQWFVLGPTGGRLLATFGGLNLTDIPVPGDYDGNGRAEPAVYRPSTAQWFVLGPTGGKLQGTFGAKNLTDIPVPGDYDGVGYTQLAVYRPSTAQWFVLGPSGGRQLAVFGGFNLFDYPLTGPTGSLKKLGKAGTIRIASVSAGTVSAALSTAAPAATPTTTPTTPPTTTTPAKPAAAAPRRPVPQAAAVDALLARGPLKLARRAAAARWRAAGR